MRVAYYVVNSVFFSTFVLAFDGPSTFTADFPEVGLSVVTASYKGENNGHDDEMQDYSSVNRIGDRVGVCLCDGHRNADFARYAAKRLPLNVEKNLIDHDVISEASFGGYREFLAAGICADPVKKALAYSFMQTHEDGLDSSEVRIFSMPFYRRDIGRGYFLSTSGTTALMALCDSGIPKNVTCAWVGDSAAMIVRADGTAALLTPEHKPVGAEAERIVRMGGVIKDGRVVTIIDKRVSLTLNMSRSLGDPTALGVIPAPEMVTDKLSLGDILVMFSDGVSDSFRGIPFDGRFVTCLAEAFPIIAARVRESWTAGANPRFTAADLAMHARSLWFSGNKLPPGYVDDITVQVCVPYEVKKDGVS